MISYATRSQSLRALEDPEEMGSGSLVGICSSLKPAAGTPGRSAVRSLLTSGLSAVQACYPNVFLLDIRDHPPPLFDGRFPQEIHNETVQFLYSCVHRAGSLLLAVPAYWSGVSGVFKNFIDVLCGPSYELTDPPRTVFTNKPVGLLVVGADDDSSELGCTQASQIMASTGAKIVGSPILVSNPRRGEIDFGAMYRDVVVLGAELARCAYLESVKKSG